MAPQTSGTTPGERLPDAVVRDLLSSERRRRALRILDRLERPVVVDELAAAILAAERGTRQDEIPAAERAAVREAFYTEHLPKLTATGVVTYDSMVGTVQLTNPEILPDTEER